MPSCQPGQGSQSAQSSGRGFEGAPQAQPFLVLFPKHLRGTCDILASPRRELRFTEEKRLTRGPWRISGDQESHPVPEPSSTHTDSPSPSLTPALSLVTLPRGQRVVLPLQTALPASCPATPAPGSEYCAVSLIGVGTLVHAKPPTNPHHTCCFCATDGWGN